MSCDLTIGHNHDCKGVGGSREWFIGELNNFSFTETSGVITAISKASGKRFWKYAQILESSEGSSTLSVSGGAGTIVFAHEVNLLLQKKQTATRNEIILLAKNRLVIIERDNNGKYWLYGRENGLTLDGATSKSGKALADASAYTLPFKGVEMEDIIEVDADVAADLEIPGGVTGIGSMSIGSTFIIG